MRFGAILRAMLTQRNMELHVEDDLKRSAKLWRQGMVDKVHDLIKERPPLGEERQWDEWRRKDAIRQAVSACGQTVLIAGGA